MGIWQENYHSLLNDVRDPRVDDWFLMSSALPVLGLCLLYVFVVWFAGPAFMKHRQPYDIKLLTITYNLFQTLLSLWLFQKASYFWLTGRYNWICQPVDYSRSKDGMLAVDMTWWFFFSKLIDSIDSYFFVLRKKWAHISYLHVFHHGIMPFSSWIGVRYAGGGHGTLSVLLNMGVHVLMYFYYLLTLMGPTVQKNLWWKRYITLAQLGQFVIFSVHASLPIVFINCDFPNICCWVIIFHGVTFFLLFSTFYRETYITKSKTESLKKAGKNRDGMVKYDSIFEKSFSTTSRTV